MPSHVSALIIITLALNFGLFQKQICAQTRCEEHCTFGGALHCPQCNDEPHDNANSGQDLRVLTEISLYIICYMVGTYACQNFEKPEFKLLADGNRQKCENTCVASK